MQRSFVCCCGRAISVTSCGYCARGEVLKALGWASTTSKKGCWCPACIVRTGYPLPDKRSARVCTSCGQTCSELEHAAYQASESQTPIVSAIPAASPSELCAPLFDEYSLPFEAGDTYMGICPLPRDIGGYFFPWKDWKYQTCGDAISALCMRIDALLHYQVDTAARRFCSA